MGCGLGFVRVPPAKSGGTNETQFRFLNRLLTVTRDQGGRSPRTPTMIAIGLKNFQHILALILGIFALISPRHLNYIVAIWLIVVALIGLGLVR
jgi:hypothetical protein